MDDLEASPLRWGRAFVAGLLAEVVLMLVSIPVFASMADPVPTLSLLIPPASFVVFVGAGYWSARPVPEIGMLQGALAGFMAVALYAVLIGLAWFFVSQADVTDSLTPAYLLSHALKVAGGAVGGWWLARRRAAAA